MQACGSPSKLTFMTAGASAPQGGVSVIFQSGSTESQNSQWVSFLQAENQWHSMRSTELQDLHWVSLLHASRGPESRTHKGLLSGGRDPRAGGA